MENQHEPISAELIRDVCQRLREDKRVRQALPNGGVLNIDRLRPFLCVYRRNPARIDVGTGRFVTAEASYLLAPGNAPVRKGLQKLVREVANLGAARFGAFLILEIWAAADSDVPHLTDDITGEPLLPRPYFRILTREPHRAEGTIATLENELRRVKYRRQSGDVEINLHSRNHPKGATQLVSAAIAEPINCHVVGLEVRPIYRNGDTHEVFDEILRSLCRQVSRAVKKSLFAFTLHRTNVRPEHYFSLGRTSLPKQVWNVDRKLAEVSGRFKFLLAVTPINAERSWHEFSESGFKKDPRFVYRPLGAHPMLLKRTLMNVPVERVEDPTLANLFCQTQDELDRQITMLMDVNSKRFLAGSLQVFGGVDSGLLERAERILQTCLPVQPSGVASLSARQFARKARQEIHFYQHRSPLFTASAVVRDDIYSGLLSTGGDLLIGRETTIDPRRADALLQHEVGTHLVTYYNGQSQPLRLLKVGLAGYDALQEGLAVLSEYLVGGLSTARMRTLAARVVAVHRMIQGSTFCETFQTLHETYGFDPHVAYTITLRVYRAGGLTKDAIYLRGLVEIMLYLAKGGDVEPLLVGKLAVEHIPVVKELLYREVIRKPIFRPRYLELESASARLSRIAAGAGVLDLIEPNVAAGD